MEFNDFHKEIINDNPEFVSKETMCNIMGICQSTGYKLLKRGIIPYNKRVEKSVHFYDIAVIDIVKYMQQQNSLFKLECKYKMKMKAICECDFKNENDVLKISDVSRLLGYCKESIRRWIENGHLGAYRVKQRLYISKEDLIDFMLTEYYNKIRFKSDIHKRMLTQVYNQTNNIQEEL